MNQEVVVCTRPDRELRKRIITPGDYTLVPYEDSRCKLKLTDISCTNDAGVCEIEPESVIFSKNFEGNVLIGDTDCFIDCDFELILQQMCCGEVCVASMVYRDANGRLVKQISCTVALLDVTEEQLISDWSWERLHEAALHHKERGVELVKQKRLTDAFRQFSKALKFAVAVEPVDRKLVDEQRIREVTDLKIKLYNNLAHLQLQFNEHSAAFDLCTKVLQYDKDNVKALYRRSVALAGQNLYEEAWTDIQTVLRLEPTDKAAIQKANEIKPLVQSIKQNYSTVIQKMFTS